MADDLSGGASTQSVGTLTAEYRINASAGLQQVGTIMQAAEQIKVAMGNVQFKMDMGNAPEMLKQVTASTIALKDAQANLANATAQVRAAQEQAALALAGRRQQETLTAESIRMTTDMEGRARVEKANLAAATQAATLATQQQRTANAALAADEIRLSGERKAAIDALTVKNKELSAEIKQGTLDRRAQAEEDARLAAAEREVNTAQGNSLQSLTDWIAKGAEFRLGQIAMQQALYGVRDAFGSVIEAGIGWQAKLNEIQNNTTMTNADTASMDIAIRNLAAVAPINMEAVAQGYRHIASEGFNASDSVKIANEAAMSAIATGADQEKTLNLLAIGLHIFGANANEATQYMNVFHLSAAAGNQTLEQFVASGGRALSVAASFGVSVTDASSALAALTREGYSAQQSTTMLRDIMTHIADPSKAATQEILALSKATGIDLVYDFSSAGLASKGLAQILEDVRKATGGNTEEMLKLIPGLRGGLGEVVLLGNGYKDFQTILQQNTDTFKNQTNPTLDSYNRTVNTASFQMGVLRNEFKLFEIALGTALIPLIKAATQEFQKLLQALGVDFNIPGFDQFKQQADAAKSSTDNLTSATQSAKAAVENHSESVKASSQAIIDNSKALDGVNKELAANKLLLDAATEAGNVYKNQMDSVNERIRAVKDKYQPGITADENTLRQIALLTPEQNQRKIDELKLNQQEINLKINKPDTSEFDKTIADMRDKLDNLAEADTAAVDQRISDLTQKIRDLGVGATNQIDQQILNIRGQLAGIGNTTALDRQIQDLQELINKPPDSTAQQGNTMIALQEQLAAGKISQAQFDQQFGSTSLQKQGIEEQNLARKSGLELQLQMLKESQEQQKRADEDHKLALDKQLQSLDLQKQQMELTNRIAKEGLQAQLNAATDERKGIIDAHNDLVNQYNLNIRIAEHKKTAALADYNAGLAQITLEKERYALLDSQDQVARDIASYPIKLRLDEAKQAMADALVPLQSEKDGIQANIDKNNEYIRGLQDTKRQLDENAQVYKDAIKEAQKPIVNENPASPPEGLPVIPPLNTGGPVPTTEPKYAQEHWDATHNRETGLELWIDSITTKFKAFGDYVINDLPNIISAIESAFNGIKIEAKLDLAAIIQGVDFVKAMAQLISDVYEGNFPAIKGDLIALGAAATNPSALSPGGGYKPENDPNNPSANIPSPNNRTGTPYETGITNYGNTNVMPSQPDGSSQIIAANISNAIGEYIIDMFKGFGRDIRGDNKKSVEVSVGAADPNSDAQGNIDAFTQHIRDVMGPGSDTDAAVKQFLDQISGEQMTQGIDQATKDAEDSFNRSFGRNSGGIPDTITQFGTYAQGVFGRGGQIDQYVGNGGQVSQTLTDMQGAFQRNFDANGRLRDPVNGWSTFMGTTLGTGGTIAGFIGSGGSMDTIIGNLQQLMTLQLGTPGAGTQKPVSDFVDHVQGAFGSGKDIDLLIGNGGSYDTSLNAADTHTQDMFGAKGTGITSLDQFVKGVQDIFKQGGTIAQAMSPFGDVMTAGFTPGIDSINTFMTALSAAIAKVGEWFGDKTLSGITWTNITIGAGGGTGGAEHHATGLGGGMPGHWAMIGERGPEAMYVPSGATIIPNHMLPGHAEGLVGSGNASLPSLLLSGILGPTGTLFQGRAQSDLTALISRLTGAHHQGSVGSRGSGFMTPRGDAGVLEQWYSIIEAAAQSNSVPDWLIGAIIMHESQGNPGVTGPFGIGALGLMQVVPSGPGFNRGYTPEQIALLSGTSVDAITFQINQGAQILSGFIKSTSSLDEALQGYAGPTYTSEMSAASGVPGGLDFYQELSGYYKDPVLAALADAQRRQFVGPTQTGGIANVEGMPGDQLMAIAQGDLVGTFGWCEQYVGDVMQMAGLRYARASDAEAHSHMQNLQPGVGPLGAITFFPDTYSGLGHVAFSMGTGNSVWGTIKGGREQSDVGVLDVTGWQPYGWTDNPAYNGGWITEPTATIGMYSGKRGTLGERGVERVTANHQLGGGGDFGITFEKDAIVVNDGKPTADASKIRIGSITLEDFYSRGLTRS